MAPIGGMNTRFYRINNGEHYTQCSIVGSLQLDSANRNTMKERQCNSLQNDRYRVLEMVKRNEY